jgi:hypothetical protein
VSKIIQSTLTKDFNFRSINRIEKALKVIKKDSELTQILLKHENDLKETRTVNFLEREGEGLSEQMKTRQTNHHLKLHIPELSQNKKLWDYSHN